VTSLAQIASQLLEQQKESSAQTQLLMEGFEQPGVVCAKQQSPGPVAPQLPQPSLVTSPTQMLSQAVAQQNGSTAHTQELIDGTLQPGVV
jgi:hypothetical protein